MNQSKSDDVRISKHLSRKGYAERQFDKWVKWAISTNGVVRYKDILKKQEFYGVAKKEQ